MPRRKCIFNEKLQKIFPFLKKGKDDSHVNCLKCGGRFSMASRGRGDILIHIKSKKHQRCTKPFPSEQTIEDSGAIKKKKLHIKICRICRNLNITSSSTNLFEGGHSLLEQIRNLTGCSLVDEMDLPKYICGDCEELVNKAHKFREMCLNSELFFFSTKWEEEKYKDQLAEENSNSSNEDKLIKPQEIENIIVDIEVEDIANYTKENDVLEMEKFNECEENKIDNNLFIKKELELSKSTKCDKKSINNTIGAKDKADLLICDRCGNHFTSRQHFKTHLRRHTNIKPFKCEICPKQCYTPTELKNHMRRHTGEKPFPCKYCDRRFSDYSSRVWHERTHTNERPFSCNQCGKTFTRANLLRKHLLVHTGERAFKCFECNKAFQTRTSLTVHGRSILHKQMVERQMQKKDANNLENVQNTDVKT